MNLLHGRIASLRGTRSSPIGLICFSCCVPCALRFISLAQLISISQGIQRNLVHNGSNTGVLQLP